MDTEIIQSSCYLETLISSMSKHELLLPSFQREKVWTTKLDLELLDSIAHNIPIGMIFMWGTTLPIDTKDADFSQKLGHYYQYLLDGAQRTYCLRACTEGKTNYYYSVKENKFVCVKKSSLVTDYIPIQYIMPSNLLDTLKFMRILNDERLVEAIQGLLNNFRTCRISTLLINTDNVDYMADVYYRMIRNTVTISKTDFNTFVKGIKSVM